MSLKHACSHAKIVAMDGENTNQVFLEEMFYLNIRFQLVALRNIEFQPHRHGN